MTLGRLVPSWMRRFVRDESGVMTVHNLFLTVTCCAVGAAGLDVTHFYAARTELQVAADIAAHSALYLRRSGATASVARTAAIDAAEYGLPEGTYGKVLELTDIVFGTWDADTAEFKPLAATSMVMPTAVEVTTNRADDNPVGSFLFRVMGVDSMDVRASAVYTTVGDPCAHMQGLFSEGSVNPEGNNYYSANFCVHSNSTVPFNNNNRFHLESSVSAPSLTNITCSGNRTDIGTKCPNLDSVWREATYDLEQYLAPLRPSGTGVESASTLMQDVQGALPDWNWDGIDQSSNTITSASDIEQGRVNYMDCGKGGSIELNGSYTKTVLLLNNCSVVIKKNASVSLTDTIIYTTSTDSRDSFAFKGSGFQIGTDTDCNGSGMAALLTRGGFNSPSNLGFNNAVIRALDNVKFAAQGSSMGLSMVTGAGGIDPTSNNTFVACPSTTEVGSGGEFSFALAR